MATESVVIGPIGNGNGSSAGIIRTITLCLKFSISGAIILAICYFTMTSIVPVMKELSNPTAPNAPIDKNAPTFVKAIQQTRQVVAKNDAHVANLNSIIDTQFDEAAITPTQNLAAMAPGQVQPEAQAQPQPVVAAPEPVAPPKPVKVSVYSPGGPVEVTSIQSPLSTLSTDMIKELVTQVTNFDINGIRNGSNPRIVMGGVLVKVGDMVDYQRELTFDGINHKKRLLLFSNPQGDIFTRTY